VVNRVAFAVPGDLATPTGGYAYDRRIIAELQKLGWQVDVVGLGDGFPRPTWETKVGAKKKLAELPKGCPIVIDGLAFGVLNEAARELGERNPLIASSRGLGDLVLAAVWAGADALVVGLGGSATVDGGAGMGEVLRELSVETTVLCDVRTTLGDAARLFGPQKGASPADVAILEQRLAEMTELRPYADLPGSGAAGGLGAAFAALGADLVPGAEAVLDLIGFDERLSGCDLVVTGEGQVDRTTAEGKAPGVVAARAAAAGVRGVVFGGRVVCALEGAETVSLSGDRARAREDLADLGRRLVA